jgi:ABC-type uncharacterized transport system auxiliary subunit
MEKGDTMMAKRYARRLAVVAVLALALALSGCSNSKKGNGYSYSPSTHPAALTDVVTATG